MKNEAIERLLERYWEGESTLEEEQQLKEYFAAGNVDVRFARFAPLFKAIAVEKNVIAPAHKAVITGANRFQWRQWAAAASVILVVTAGIWWSNRQPAETSQAVVNINAAPPAHYETTPQAAPAPEIKPEKDTLLAKAVQKVRKKLHRKSPEEKEREEAEKAYAEVKAALELVSSKLNKGKSAAAKNLNHLESIDILTRKKKSIDG